MTTQRRNGRERAGEVGIGKSTAAALWIFMLAGALAATGCGPREPTYVAPLQDPGVSNPAHLTADAVLLVRARLHGSTLPQVMSVVRMADAISTVHHALDSFDQTSASVLGQAAALAVADGRAEDARGMVVAAQEAEKDTAEFYADVATSLVDAGHYAFARDMAFDGRDRYPDDEELLAVADRAIDEDPVLLPPEIRRIEPGKGADLIKALGGGSTVTLKAKSGDENVAAFKPDQDLGQSMFRSEVAYYRLCALLRCSFRVPYNEHVKISRDDFEALYSVVDSPKQRGYRSKFVHLRWKEENGVEYLHGTWKEWVPTFTGFPIEATSAWTDWLQPAATTEYSQPVRDWLPVLAESAGPRGWARHKRRVEYAGDLTVGDVAQQISDILVVDFLANNWDRFSGDPELYGANCHIEPGGLLALDNGAAFPAWDTKRVERRLKLTRRFSRKLIAALRRLDHDKTLHRLFPEPSTDERNRFEIFWNRREQLLDYVDGLIEKHGEDAVLVFP